MGQLTIITGGNVGRDPEIRTMQDGGRVANLAVATSDRWRDKTTGEKKERTEWHRVVVFNDNLITLIEKHVGKGTKLSIVGQNQTRDWMDGDVKRYTTEVVIQKFGGSLEILGGWKADGTTKSVKSQTPPPRDLDDEIPF